MSKKKLSLLVFAIVMLIGYDLAAADPAYRDTVSNLEKICVGSNWNPKTGNNRYVPTDTLLYADKPKVVRCKNHVSCHKHWFHRDCDYRREWNAEESICDAADRGRTLDETKEEWKASTNDWETCWYMKCKTGTGFYAGNIETEQIDFSKCQPCVKNEFVVVVDDDTERTYKTTQRNIQ